MDTIIRGRGLFALAISGLGVEHLICARSAETAVWTSPHVPVMPWVPAYPWMAYLTGIALITAGSSILVNRGARIAGIFRSSVLGESGGGDLGFGTGWAT